MAEAGVLPKILGSLSFWERLYYKAPGVAGGRECCGDRGLVVGPECLHHQFGSCRRR
jgi:hypothetical protein